MHMAVSNRRARCRRWCRQTSEIISADSQPHCSRSKALNRRRRCSSPANLFSETLSSYAAAQPYCSQSPVNDGIHTVYRIVSAMSNSHTLSGIVSTEQTFIVQILLGKILLSVFYIQDNIISPRNRYFFLQISKHSIFFLVIFQVCRLGVN